MSVGNTSHLRSYQPRPPRADSCKRQLGRVANDLSQLVRKLTAFGAILVADTLVAGIYGMNFAVMPELHWQYGYPMALGLMGLISVLMAWYFRQKDWL